MPLVAHWRKGEMSLQSPRISLVDLVLDTAPEKSSLKLAKLRIYTERKLM